MNRLSNPLLIASTNAVLAILAFLLFVFPRFTNFGAFLSLLILFLLAIDVILVIRDLFRAGTRGRAIVAVVLWLPLLFFFSMIMQWEGSLYFDLEGNPPVFETRGLSGFCEMDIYGPEQENAEWSGDDIGLVWSIDHATGTFPFEAKFKYGELPRGFDQRTWNAPPPLNPNITYKVVVDRCMGGPQNFSLRGNVMSHYVPNPNVCWGPIKVPERQDPAYVRVDCKTQKPLPMSTRATERLKQYREKKIIWY